MRNCGEIDMKQPSLSERIAQRVQSKKPNQAKNNRSAFLALRDEIRQALNDNYTKKEIWETLRDEQKIMFGYTAFTRYVNRLILSNNKQEKSPNTEIQTPIEKPSKKPVQQTPSVESTEKADTNVIKNFVYDPLILTKDDL